MSRSLVSPQTMIALISLVVSPLPPTAAAQAPASLSKEAMYFYKLALCGDKPADQVDFWAKEFDRQAYQNATPNEFARQQYRERTRTLLQKGLDKVSFTDKYSGVFFGELGEYSFADHGFPLKVTSNLQYSIGGIAIYGGRPEHIVNSADYRWLVPMSEAAASAYVASHQDGRGKVDRNVDLKVIYSLVHENQICRPYDVWFSTYFHSIEVFDGQAPNSRLASLRPRTTLEQARRDAPEKLRALLSSNRELDGTWQAGALTLRILSFDASTGLVTGEMDFFNNFSTASHGVSDPPIKPPKIGWSSRASGTVARDTISLTATWTETSYLGKTSKGQARFKLRLDLTAHALAGQWYWIDLDDGGKESSMGPATFKLDGREPR